MTTVCWGVLSRAGSLLQDQRHHVCWTLLEGLLQETCHALNAMVVAADRLAWHGQ
jgi:hypothetical protein